MAARNSRDPLADEFLRYLEVERNVSPRTLAVYRDALAAFRLQKNPTPWKKCSGDSFRNYLFAAMKKGQARSYIRLQFSAFRTFYRFLIKRKGLAHDPVRELQLPKSDETLPLVVSRRQLVDLMTARWEVGETRAAGGGSTQGAGGIRSWGAPPTTG